MEPRIEVSFIIFGDISPDRITESLGILPTKTWRKGDLIQRTKLARKEDGWVLSVGDVATSYDLEDNIKPLLNVLIQRSEKIVSFCTHHHLHSEISCAIYVVDETPAINFGQETIEKIAQLRTMIDIDIILTAG